MPHLSVFLLGSFRCVLDETVVSGFRSNKNRALLAYLAAEAGQVFSRDALAGLFWPDQPEDAARLNLRQSLFRLGQLLHRGNPRPPFLNITRQDVSFDPASDHWLDIVTFSNLIKTCQTHTHPGRAACAPCAARLTQAMAIYQAEFMSGFFLEGSIAFEEWMLLKREWLRHQALSALGDLAAYHLEQGALEEAYRFARRRIELDAYNEDAYRQAMLALAQAGRRSEALAQFEICSKLLDDELGVEPEDGLLALYEQIRAGEALSLDPRLQNRPVEPVTDQASAPVIERRSQPALPGAPQPVTPFIGREAELARLSERLLDSRYRLVSLVGPGGIGKTRLALAAVEAARPVFAHGVLFVSFAGLLPTCGEHLPQAAVDLLVQVVGGAVGVDFSARLPLQSQLFEYLREKELLLVLDNLEQFLTASCYGAVTEFLLNLLAQAPHLCLLVTSRERLGLQAEALLSLDGLPVPDEDAVLEGSNYSSLVLFAERARRADPYFELTSQVTPEIAGICRLVNGMPLGIELAAAWTAHYTPSEILAAVRQNLRFLETQMPDVPERHRSLQAVFDSSWELLSDDEQALLGQLTIFRGSFQRQAALTICEGKLGVLTSLLDKSWLMSLAPGRYSLHELVRQFVVQKDRGLDQVIQPVEGVLSKLQERYNRWYLEFLAQKEHALWGEKPRQALLDLQAESDNLLQAWQWAINQDEDAAMQRRAAELSSFYQALGLYSEGTSVLEAAVSRLRALCGPASEATCPSESESSERGLALGWLLVEQAQLFFQSGQYEQANRAAQEGIDWGRACQSLSIRADGCLVWGQTSFGLGDLPGALQCLDEAFQLAQEAQRPYTQARALRNIGSIYWQQGRYAEAQEWFQRSLAFSRRFGYRREEAASLNQLANVRYYLGYALQAQQTYQQALQVGRESGDRQGEGVVLMHLGIVERDLGNLSASLSLFWQALAMMQELGARRLEGVVLNNLGMVWHDLGRYTQAKESLETALQIFNAIGYLRGSAYAHLYLSAACLRLEAVSAGLEQAQLGLHIARQIGEPNCEGASLGFYAHALAALGDLDGAADTYRQALEIWRRIGPAKMAAEPLAGLALVCLAQGDETGCMRNLDGALDILNKQDLVGLFEPLWAYTACYQVLVRCQDRRAPLVLRQGYRILQQRAAQIKQDDLRESFLYQVRAHREILKAMDQSP